MLRIYSINRRVYDFGLDVWCLAFKIRDLKNADGAEAYGLYL